MIVCHKLRCENPATVFPEYGGHFCDFHAFAEGAAEWDSRRLKLEARRLTWLMQCILRAAEHNGRWLLVRSQMHSARILERRGFVEVVRTVRMKAVTSRP